MFPVSPSKNMVQASLYVTRTPAAVITACVPRQSEITQTGNLFLCLVGAVIFPVDSGREDSFRAPATAREETYHRSPLASVLQAASRPSRARAKAGAEYGKYAAAQFA